MDSKILKILFIIPSSMPADEQEAFLGKKSILRTPLFSMPLGIIDLASYIRAHVDNVEIKILDLGKELYKVYMDYESAPERTVDDFLISELDSVDFNPDIVGLSILFSSAHHTTMRIAELAKKKWSNVKVIMGGNHATNFCDHILEHDSVDYVARGEGEISFLQLIQSMQAGKEDVCITGIIDKRKAKSGQLDSGPVIEDLDDIPMPAFDLLDLDIYKAGVGASMMHSRGCVFKCTFCASHTVNGRDMRYKSIGRIVKEMDLLIRDYQFKTLYIEDDLFASDKKQFLPLAEAVAKRNYDIKIRLPQGLSVAMMGEEMIDAMISMGINEASIAIESGSAYTQKNIIKKHVNLNKAREVLEFLRGKDFYFYVNFILGFPGETDELRQETLDYLRSLDVDWVYVFHAIPLLGTEMYEQFVDMGAINPNNFDWDNVRLGRRGFDTPDITKEELTRLIYDTNIDVNFFNNRNMKHGRYERAIELFDKLIIRPYPFHVVGKYCKALCFLSLKDEDQANDIFKDCAEWIEKNEESRRLYERYGDRMPNLTPFLTQTTCVSPS